MHAFIHSFTQWSFMEDLPCVKHHALQGDTTLSLSCLQSAEGGRQARSWWRYLENRHCGGTYGPLSAAVTEGAPTKSRLPTTEPGTAGCCTLLFAHPGSREKATSRSRPARGSLTATSPINEETLLLCGRSGPIYSLAVNYVPGTRSCFTKSSHASQSLQ